MVGLGTATTTPEVARAVILLIVVATLLRIGFAWALGLGVDESYMVASGRTLSLGYFDHPPAAWWMQWMAAHLFGSEAPLVVRAPFIAAFALSTWLMFRLGSVVYGSRAGLLAAITLNLSPVFGVTTGTWVLPDGPLDCALLGAALCLVRAVEGRGVTWWAGAGLWAGLALFSKYTAFLTVAGAFAFLLISSRHRHWLARPEPYLAGVLAAAVFAPVIAWNAAHHWASFAFQGDRAEGLRFRPAQPIVVLAGEALFVLPWIWLGMALAVWDALSRRVLRGHLSRSAGQVDRAHGLPLRLAAEMNRASRSPPLPEGEVGPHSGPGEGLLLSLAAPPIIVFALIALWSGGRVLFHWAAPGYLMLFPLLGAWLAERPRLARRGVAATACIVVLAVAIVSTDVRLDWLRPAFATLHARDPIVEAVDWHSIRTNLEARGLLSPGVVVGVPDWRDAGKIAYALGPAVTVTCLDRDARQFGFVAAAGEFIGRNILVLTPDHPERIARRLRPVFASLAQLSPAPIRVAGRVAGEVAVFQGTDFRAWPSYPQASAYASPTRSGNGIAVQLSPPSLVPNSAPVFAVK